MQVAGRRFLTRTAVAAAALTALLDLQSAGSVRRPTAEALTFSDQARRYLALQYRSYPTGFLGCMIGEMRAGFAVVRRIAPADVDQSRSTPTRVSPEQSCEAAGWSSTIGMIHSHPGGENCWYYFPGTVVATSDAQSFAGQSYAVDAIMCGDHIVWIGRDRQERRLSLLAADGPTASAASTR